MSHVHRPKESMLDAPLDDGWDEAPPQDPQSGFGANRQPPNADDGFVPRLDAAGIFAPLEPIAYVIQAIDLCPGAPGMWAGFGFSGKTVAAQAAALAIAAGLGKVWGAFNAPQGKAVHIDWEQGPRLTRERYQRLGAAMMIGPSDIGDRLSLVSMPSRYLDEPAAEAELCKLADGVQLVIVDSLRAAAPSLDENSSDVRRVLDTLGRVSSRTGAAFLVIHHARKPNQQQAGGTKMAIRGSGALFDACGSVLVFEAEKGQPTRVSHEKARASGVLTDDFTLTIADVPDGSNPRAGLVVTAEAAPSREQQNEDAARDRQLARSKQLREELTALFQEKRELGGTDSIAERIGRKAADVRRVLGSMVSDGLVESVGNTSNRRHRWLGRE